MRREHSRSTRWIIHSERSSKLALIHIHTHQINAFTSSLYRQNTLSYSAAGQNSMVLMEPPHCKSARSHNTAHTYIHAVLHSPLCPGRTWGFRSHLEASHSTFPWKTVTPQTNKPTMNLQWPQNQAMTTFKVIQFGFGSQHWQPER